MVKSGAKWSKNSVFFEMFFQKLAGCFHLCSLNLFKEPAERAVKGIVYR